MLPGMVDRTCDRPDDNPRARPGHPGDGNGACIGDGATMSFHATTGVRSDAVRFTHPACIRATQASGTGHARPAGLRGALFGLATYGTYGLTNWATLRHWPGSIVAIDIGWGVVLCAISAMAASVTWQLLRPR